MANVKELREAVCRAILDGPGKSVAEARMAAFAGDAGSGALDQYLNKVRVSAYKVIDEDIAALRSDGLTDDHIFELSVAAALGHATRQHDHAVAMLTAALQPKAAP